MPTNKPLISLPAAELMPTGVDNEKILQRRAQLLSQPLGIKKSVTTQVNYILLTIAPKQFYGIPHQYAAEVLPMTALTTLPNVANFMAGIMNWRGRLLPVIDLSHLFHLAIDPLTQGNFIIILSDKHLCIGVKAHTIIGDEQYDKTQIQSPLDLPGGVPMKYLLGLAQGKNAIINIPSLFTDIEAQLTHKN